MQVPVNASTFSKKAIGIFALALVFAVALIAGCIKKDHNQEPILLPQLGAPDVFVLGDSQISFGAGAFHLDFFENLTRKCSPNAAEQASLNKLGLRKVVALGVRSSSLNNWVAKDEPTKAVICEVDKKFGVNAGAYGFSGNRGRQYIQVGKGAEYQFCSRGTAPLQSIFRNDYYMPKLFVMAFLGNSAQRWAKNPADAVSDVKQAMLQIPQNTPCIFMTTAPSYSAESNAMRQQAQASIKTAFQSVGRRCSFVEGITPQTLAQNTNNASYFRTNDAGVVIDPLHPNTDAAKKFFELITPQLCHAVFEQINPSVANVN